MENLFEPQYFEAVEKGITVSYGNKSYRVQDDGKDWLHIVVKGKKLGIDKLKQSGFQPGTEADHTLEKAVELSKNSLNVK